MPAGAANSDAPGASCRTNCRRARCGDFVVDPTEGCDLGTLNSDADGSICSSSCIGAILPGLSPPNTTHAKHVIDRSAGDR